MAVREKLLANVYFNQVGCGYKVSLLNQTVANDDLASQRRLADTQCHIH